MHPTPPPLTARHKLVVVLAAAHLLLATSSMLGLRQFIPERGPAKLVHIYAQWTGAGSRFNFFAPSINPSMRVGFDVTRGSGEVLQDDLQSSNDSMNTRAYCMLLRFGVKKLQDDLARSWAATMFGRHPDAHRVSVSMSALRMPTMGQYRAGERPEWQELYRADFEHRAPALPPHARAETP